jgi:hypothetical protein
LTRNKGIEHRANLEQPSSFHSATGSVVIAAMTISFVFDVGPADSSVKTTDTSATALAGG